MTVLGLDVGHSAVKMSYRGKAGIERVIFPSVVSPAIAISDRSAADAAANDTVEVEGNKFFVGETAVHESGATQSSGLHHRWIDSIEYKVLIQAAINIAMRDAGKIEMIVVGLPPVIMRERQLAVRNLVSTMTDADVRVFPEPSGVLYSVAINEDGVSVEDAPSNVGVIAVGRYTTDFMALVEGKWMENAAGSVGGMSKAAELLRRRLGEDGVHVDPIIADQALRNKSLRHYGKDMDVTKPAEGAMQILVSSIIDGAAMAFGDVESRLEAIYVAGGGADMLMPTLTGQWPHLSLVKNPRMAVAEGFRRVGEMRMSLTGAK